MGIDLQLGASARRYGTCGSITRTKTVHGVILVLLVLLSPRLLWQAERKPRTVRARVTAYCPCAECTDGDGVTSVGDDAYVLDGVAADPKRLPYRTRVRIPGAGLKEVDDTGAAMKRGKTLRLDVRFATHAEALEWGVKYLQVEVLE